MIQKLYCCGENETIKNLLLIKKINNTSCKTFSSIINKNTSIGRMSKRKIAL